MMLLVLSLAKWYYTCPIIWYHSFLILYDLVEDIKGDLSGLFEKLCLYLLMPSRMFDAYCLRQAIEVL